MEAARPIPYARGMRWRVGLLFHRGGVLVSAALGLGCSPKVHLEFDDETLLPADAGLGTGARDESGGRETGRDDDGDGDDDDDNDDGDDMGDDRGDGLLIEDDGGSTGRGVTSTSGTPWPGSTSGLMSGDSSPTTDADTRGTDSTTDGTRDCRLQGPCPAGQLCVNDECVPVPDPCADGADLAFCCPGGFDHDGRCCEAGVDDEGWCIEVACLSDEDCAPGHACLGSMCEPVTDVLRCESESPLTTTPMVMVADFMPSPPAAYGDFNGDGVQGLASYTALGIWLLDEPSPATLLPIEATGGTIELALAAGDFDGNGSDDVVFSLVDPRSTQVHLSHGAALDPDPSFVFGFAPQDLQVGDFDGDGSLDIARVDRGWINVAFGLGDGTFGEEISIPGYALSVGSSGSRDTMVVSGHGTVSLFQFDADRNSASTTLAHSPTIHNAALLSDLEGDESVELLTVTNRRSGTVLSVWTGVGSEPGSMPTGPARYRIAGSFHMVVPAPPEGRYAVLAGSSGVVHLRDLAPPCWSPVIEAPVNTLVRGKVPQDGEVLVGIDEGLTRIVAR